MSTFTYIVVNQSSMREAAMLAHAGDSFAPLAHTDYDGDNYDRGDHDAAYRCAARMRAAALRCAPEGSQLWQDIRAVRPSSLREMMLRGGVARLIVGENVLVGGEAADPRLAAAVEHIQIAAASAEAAFDAREVTRSAADFLAAAGRTLGAGTPSRLQIEA